MRVHPAMIYADSAAYSKCSSFQLCSRARSASDLYSPPSLFCCSKHFLNILCGRYFCQDLSQMHNAAYAYVYPQKGAVSAFHKVNPVLQENFHFFINDSRKNDPAIDSPASATFSLISSVLIHQNLKKSYPLFHFSSFSFLFYPRESAPYPCLLFRFPCNAPYNLPAA